MLRPTLIVLFTTLFGACTTETSGSQKSSVQGGETGPEPAAAANDRVLYRTDSRWTPSTDAFGDTSMVLEKFYEVIALYPTGYAWVGARSDDIETCGAPKKDPKGKDLCVEYEISGSTITLGAKTQSYEPKGNDAVVLDGREWRVLPANASAQGSLTLAGYFGAQSRVTSNVQGATLELAADGSFTAKRIENAYPILAYELWSTGCRGGCELSGTYTTDAHSITFTTSSGKAQTFFFRAEESEVQIGDEWYRRD